MKFIKVRAQFDAPDIELAEERICDIFFSFNLKGVICDVPVEEPDEGFGTNTLPKPESYAVTGYFPAIDASEIVIGTLREKTAALTGFNIHVTLSTAVVDEKEWADDWKDYFEVTPVTDRIIVKPEWKPYTPKSGELVIHLDPGMAFGTGTHPTTAMCIRLMESYLNPGDDFLDVGTGSGISMIAAALLGAGRMTGIDTDETAVAIARANLEKNRVPPGRYRLACTTIKGTGQRPRRLIAANIIAQVIARISRDLTLRMDADSVAILSGIIRERLPEVRQSLEMQGLKVAEQIFTDEWVALAVRKAS